MVPAAVFREVAERWLGSFVTREEGLRVLAAASGMHPDSWRKRLSFDQFKLRTGGWGAHGWYGMDTVDEDKVDEFLTAIGRTDLWHAEPLSEFLPEATPADEDFHATCVDCGTWIDWRQQGAGVTVEIGQVVNVRRQYRWFSLCAPCTSLRFPLTDRPDVTGRMTGKMSAEELGEAYRMYAREGISVREVADRLWQRYGYAHAESCVSSLWQKWNRAGWPLRESDGRKAKPRPGDRRRHRRGRLPEKTLRTAYELHMRKDVSVNRLGHLLFEKHGYSTPTTCASAISNGWRRLGLKARDRIEMTRIASTKNGLSPRDHRERYRRRREAGLTNKGHQRQPMCLETVKSRARKGERCGRPALVGRDYCAAHDPAANEKRREHLARMRATSPRHSREHTVAMGTVLPDLELYYRLYGTWKPLAAATGIATATLSRNRKRQPHERMTLETLARLRPGLDRLISAALPQAA